MKHLTSKSERKFQKVMREFGQGELRSHGQKVTNPKQAVAIAYSEARDIYPNYGMKHEGGAANEPAVKGIFSIDAIEDKKFPGYTFGDDWNGWATPYFERPEANLIMEALGGTYKDGKYLFDDGYEGEDEYEKQTIDTVDGPKEVFAIGAYSWTWDNDLLRNGGGITPIRAAELAKIYSTGTAKQLWQAWTPENRDHFLMDHAIEFFELMGDDFYKSAKSFSVLSYDTLPSPIKKSVLIHHAQGMYGNGGSISRFWDVTKRQSKAAYEKSKELAGKGYDKTKAGLKKAKAYTAQKIHDKKKDIALEVLDDARDNADTKADSRALHIASNLVEENYAEGGGVEERLQKLIGQLNDTRIDLEDEDEEILADINGELEEAKTAEEVEKILSDNENYINKISDKKAIAEIKKSIAQYKTGSMATGGEVYLDMQRRKYVLIDKRTQDPWANEFFTTTEEAKAFGKQNKLNVMDRPIDIQTGNFEYTSNKRLDDLIKSWSLGKGTTPANEKRLQKMLADAKAEKERRKNSNIMSGGGGVPKSLSPAKQKLLDRINTLKATKANASESAQKAIQKKIDVLQRQFDYNPSAKEKAMDNKGKFALDVPASYSQPIYRKLWSMKILPRIHKLNGTHSIIVSSKVNLDKAYEIYSDMLKEEKQKAPALSKISRKL